MVELGHDVGVLLLDGNETGQTSERFHMLDNITVDRRGRVVLQEDPGNQPYLARVWLYDIASDTLTQLAEHDPARFASPIRLSRRMKSRQG